ncbi:hypothetical protein HOY82DRAFT_461678, partial [Tuber indicum]
FLAANPGEGVMSWKGANESAVEIDTISNMKVYSEIWGYHLEIQDVSTEDKHGH